jgi:hypothetical protein
LNKWPAAALAWASRPRFCPNTTTVNKIVLTGGEIVPKTLNQEDDLSWRLSFSQAERILERQTNEKARKCHVALKVVFKRVLKPICPILKTYHIKTLFWHFMESKTEEFWSDVSYLEVFSSLLNKLIKSLEERKCKHYFIDFINLFDDKNLKIKNSELEKLFDRAILEFYSIEHEKKNPLLYFTRKHVNILDIQDLWKKKSFWKNVCFLLLVTFTFFILTIVVYIVCLCFALLSLSSWMISLIFSIPIIFLFLVIYFLVEKLSYNACK